MMDIYMMHGSMDSSCGFLRSWPSRFCEGRGTRFRVFLSSFPNPSQREAPFFLTSLPRFPPPFLEDEASQLWLCPPPPPNAWAPRLGAVRGRVLRPGGPGPPAPGRRRRPHVAATAYRPGAWGRRPSAGEGRAGASDSRRRPPRWDRPVCGGRRRPRGDRPRAAAARGGSQGARLKKKERGRRKLRKREILARHRRSPAQARDKDCRGAQRERGMRDVGNGNGNGNWKGDDPQ